MAEEKVTKPRLSIASMIVGIILSVAGAMLLVVTYAFGNLVREAQASNNVAGSIFGTMFGLVLVIAFGGIAVGASCTNIIVSSIAMARNKRVIPFIFFLLVAVIEIILAIVIFVWSYSK